MKISACIISRNEEKLIERCLLSLKNVVDEIVLVHDGECGDNTLIIASKYTHKIFTRELAGEAEIHRPFSLRQASNDWIFQIDADEFLSEELKDFLKVFKDSRGVYGYEFLWPLYDGEKYITSKWPYKKCLFNKNKIFYLGIPHYLINVSGRTKRVELALNHEPNYNNLEWRIFKTKWLKWAKIQAEIYFKNFNNIEKFNYKGDNWPIKIQIRKKHPILLMPFEFLIPLLKNIFDGAWKSRMAGLKYALYCSLYRVMVNYYIIKTKNNIDKYGVKN